MVRIDEIEAMARSLAEAEGYSWDSSPEQEVHHSADNSPLAVFRMKKRYRARALQSLEAAR